MPSLERDVSEEWSVEENEEDGRNNKEVSNPPSSDADSVSNDKEKDQCSEEDSSSLMKKCDEDNDGDTEEVANGDEADLPIDKGWAWIVLAGSWLNIALMMGYLRGLSVLFVEYLRVFNASAAKTTLLMGVTAAVASLSALFSMNILVDKLGLRKTTFLGAVLSVTGLACAIAPINIDFIIGTHSILLGMGNAMVFGPCLVQVGLYFNKRRGLASTVAMSGVSLGGMVFPPMIRYFLDEYGLQGTMILLTGINMNMFVGASVFWPLETFKKKKKSKATQEELPLDNRYEDKSVDKLHPSVQITSKTSPIKPCSDIQLESPLLPHRRLRTESTGSKLSRTSNNVWFYASQSEFGSVMSIPKEHIHPDKNQNRTSCQCLKNMFSSLDFSLFKRPMFIFVVCYSFFSVTCYLSGAYLPALASEKGISKQDAAFFLTVMGALDFICRLPLGVLLDKKIIRVNTLMAIGLMVNGAGSLCTYFYNSYPTVFMFACINGISTCTYFGVIPIGIIEFMGIDYLAKTLGFVTLFHGLSEAIANPLMGGIRDATGSYVGAYLYLGATTYIGAILLLCEPLARSYSKRNVKTILDLDVESKPSKKC